MKTNLLSVVMGLLLWSVSASAQIGFEVIKSFGLAEAFTLRPNELIEGSDGFFYGTALGADNSGFVFKLEKVCGLATIIHHFASGTGDGIGPIAALVESSDGALYGTTVGGGSHDGGTVFRLSRDGTEYIVVHSFGSTADDARWPFSALVEGSDGALYGTTRWGGTHDHGTVFTLGKDGMDYIVLHEFLTNGLDGLRPEAALVEGSNGALYGTTLFGGSNDVGTVFKLNKDGGSYRLLHTFTTNTVDARYPGGLMEASPT